MQEAWHRSAIQYQTGFKRMGSMARTVWALISTACTFAFPMVKAMKAALFTPRWGGDLLQLC
jgi:hypothetical protein